MSQELTSTNPVVKAIVTGTAPQPARLAAARGLLPLPQSDLLEVLVALRLNEDREIAEAADETLEEQEHGDLLIAAKGDDTAITVLFYLAANTKVDRDVHEAIALNNRTPDEGIAALAGQTGDGPLLELLALNQQRLVRTPAIIEAILGNPARTSDADRRARETHKEFFEKERGAQQIADEMRAQGKTAAAEFFETAEMTVDGETLSADDAWLIAQHIEVSDAEIDDSWLPAERYEELMGESLEQRRANIENIIKSEQLEGGAPALPDRVAMIRRIMFMSPKDRMKLAMKGDREARGILIRDSNKVVACGVVHNPRVTDQEAEHIAAMRTVAGEVLRQVAMNRAWARNYPIIHNLVKNPRTPLPSVITILPRIQTRDLIMLKENRNISEAARKQALRIVQTRSGH